MTESGSRLAAFLETLAKLPPYHPVIRHPAGEGSGR